jgi:phage tail sheath protein FI
MPFGHGIKVVEINTGTRPIASLSTAIIGLVAIASDADVTAFPLNQPVLVQDVRAAIGKAGVQGTLAKSLSAISDQCSPTIVVIRVAEGVAGDGRTAEENTELNIIGTTLPDGSLTGLKALLMAESKLGVRPRIIGVPGHDSEAVTTALIPIAQKLRAMVYAKAEGDTVSDVGLVRQCCCPRPWPARQD